MKEEKLKKLLKLFEESDVDELEIDEKNFFTAGYRIKIVRRRNGLGNEIISNMVVSPNSDSQVENSVVRDTTSSIKEKSSEENQTEEGYLLRSPMVGTFYRAASPESEEFVKAGDIAKNGQTLCIVEAMKIMNEIPADQSGKVEEILVENGQPVEYDQPLFEVDPS